MLSGLLLSTREAATGASIAARGLPPVVCSPSSWRMRQCVGLRNTHRGMCSATGPIDADELKRNYVESIAALFEIVDVYKLETADVTGAYMAASRSR